MITFTHVKCIRVQVLPSNGEKNCVHEILEYTSLILPKIVEVCMSVIMHVMGDKLIITLFHINSNMIYISGNNNLSKLFYFLHFLNV